jgi:hypothetical protein
MYIDVNAELSYLILLQLHTSPKKYSNLFAETLCSIIFQLKEWDPIRGGLDMCTFS